MRTTLDIDPAVLSAARAKAKADHTSIGQALSELASAGLSATGAHRRSDRGFPTLVGNPAHKVTDELVRQYRDDS